MKTQAKPATPKELAYLQHWRKQGYFIRIDETIPLDLMTPPSFATNHPIADALIGSLILLSAMVGVVGSWLAVGAGLV